MNVINHIEYTIYKRLHDIVSNILLAFIPIMSIITIVYTIIKIYNEITIGGTVVSVYNPYDDIFYYITRLFNLVLPITIILLSAQHYNVEHEHHGYRISMVSPFSRSLLPNIELFCQIFELLLAFVSALFLSFSGFIIIDIILPRMDLMSYNETRNIVVYFVRLLFSASCIAFSQTLLHRLVQSTYIPIIIGFSLAFISIYLPFNSPYSYSNDAYYGFLGEYPLCLEDLQLMIIPLMIAFIYILTNGLYRKKIV